MAEDVKKVVIIGGGPAGWTAALYTGRANLKPVVFEGAPPNTPGGQLMITSDVENYPGFPDGVLGPELMDRFKQQAVKFDCDVRSQNIARVDLSERPYKLWTDEGDEIHAHTVIISTGATAKLLGLPKESELMASGGGVSACATCDGAFFRDVHVAVVGGGDTAMEEAMFLTRFASKVTLIHRRDVFRASKIMLDRARANEKIDWKVPFTTKEILTKKEDGPLAREIITGIKLENTETGDVEQIDVDGFFIAIGHKPNTDLFTDWLDLNEAGYIKLTERRTETRHPGVFACGDVADDYYRQAITAAGTGCQAAIEAERFLELQSL
jgi:thioredoxin reductase (NADPH)